MEGGHPRGGSCSPSPAGKNRYRAVTLSSFGTHACSSAPEPLQVRVVTSPVTDEEPSGFIGPGAVQCEGKPVWPLGAPSSLW